MSTATNQPAPFKSDRAARMAYNKAERAAEVCRDAKIARTQQARETGFSDEAFAAIRELEATEKAAWAVAEDIYTRATAQGIWIKSWHFGHNPTRDLIAANID